MKSVIVFMYMCLCYEVDVVSGGNGMNTKKYLKEHKETYLKRIQNRKVVFAEQCSMYYHC